MTVAAALGAVVAALLVVGRAPVPARVADLRRTTAPGAPGPARRTALHRLGRAVRRPFGARPDDRLDRWAGAALVVAAGAVVVGPVPAGAALGGALVAGRWRRLRRSPAGPSPVAVGRDLPDLVDLLALAVGAGLSVPAAVPVVAARAPASLRPALSEAADALAGGRPSDHVLADLGRRWGDPARPLVHALADHLRYGTPVLPALERVAAEARAARRRASEARARRLPVLLLFPLVLCTLPAFGLLTVAPLLAGTFDSLRGGHLEAPASVAPFEQESP